VQPSYDISSFFDMDNTTTDANSTEYTPTNTNSMEYTPTDINFTMSTLLTGITTVAISNSGIY
jgi:hypothetical protein